MLIATIIYIVFVIIILIINLAVFYHIWKYSQTGDIAKIFVTVYFIALLGIIVLTFLSLSIF